MNEDLMNVTMLENKEIVVTDTIEEIAIEENKIDSVVAEETVYEIDVRPEDIDVIDISEGMGWVGGDNRYHNSLLGIDGPNQHPITSITGLREELDEIERIKSIYSDKYNVANYYKWRDAAYDESGYFVSLVPDSSTIQICNGSNIFGVSVDNAGFIGGQDGSAPRDNTYGLIVTSGLVSVRAELDVNIGDYVNCNTKGYAKRSASNYGYRVLALENKHGVHYATIMLGVQADITDAIGADVIALDGRLDAAETNIVSAINVANQAYQKASEIDVSNKDMSNKVDVAIGKVDNMVSDMENLETQISSSASVAAQAQAIAQSAATSAESMRIEAVDKVGDVLSETSNLRREFEAKSIEIESELNDAIREMQNTKESMESMNAEIQGDIDDVNTEFQKLTKELEPLAVWPEGSSATDANGIAGFVARANQDSITLASMAKLEGEFGEAIAGFAQEATTDNATVKALAGYQQKDENGNPYGSFGVSSLIAQVDSNASNIKLLSKLEGEGFESLAALATQVTQNSASISTLTSHIAGDFENTYDWVVDGKDTDKVYYDQNSGLYHYYKDGQWRSTQKAYEAGLKGSLAGVQQTADENAANIEMITSIDGEFEQSLAGFVSNATSENAEIKALAEYGYEDDNGDRHYGATGIMAEVSKNKSAIEAIASHEFVDANGNTVSGLAGLQAQVDDAKTQAGLVANRIVGKYTVVPKYPEGDESKIATLDIDQIYYTTLSYIENDVKKYVVRIWVYIDSKWQSVQGFGNFINTYPNVLQKDTVYYFGDMIQYYAYWKDIYWTTTNDAYSAGLTAAISGVQVVSDEHSASIDSLSTWQGETNIAMARIEQKADVNGAYIQSTVSNMDKYAVGLHSQAYGFTLTQAINILTDGMVYVPTENCTEECYYATHKEVVEVEYIGDAAPYDHDVVYYATRSKKYWYYGYDESIKQFTMLSFEELPKYSRSFTKGYLYQWLKVDGQHRWVTVDKNYNPIEDINTSAPSVYFSNKEVTISNTDSYGYWYTNGDTITNIDGTTGTYAPYTLYKWSLAHKDNGVEKYHWVAVATLAGNSQSRAVSQVKQDANSIENRVTNVEGSAAISKQWIDDNSVNIQDVVTWKGKNADSIATFMSTANDNFVSTSQVAQIVDKDGNINAASIVTAVNKSGSSVVIDADHINLNGKVTIGDLSVEAQDNLISSSQILYGLSDGSGENNKPTKWVDQSEWNKGENVWTEGKYVWQKTIVTKVNGSTVETVVCIQGAKGEPGKTPIKGEDYFDGTNGENGTSIIWKGTFDESPSNPENGWAYYDNKAKASYVYQDGWYQMSIDGVDGQKGSDGVSIVWKGELETRPDNGEENWVYKDKNDGVVYICTGDGLWEPMVLDGNDGAPGAQGADGLSVFITYNDSVETPDVPTIDGTEGGWHTEATSNSVWMSQKVAKDAISGVWGNPIKIKGEPGATGGTGTSVTKVVIRYYISESNDNNNKPSDTADGWFEDFDEMLSQYWSLRDDNPEKNYYIWSHEKVYYDNIDPTYSSATVNSATSIISMYCKDNGVTKIDGGNIATGTITADHIASNTITADKIASKTITADQIDVENLTADTSFIENLKVDMANVTGALTVANPDGSLLLKAGNNAVEIGGWHVTESGIETEQETVGLLSDKSMRTLSSLVDEDVQKKVSIYAGYEPYTEYVTNEVWSNDGVAYFYYNLQYPIVGAELYSSKGEFYDSELTAVFERDGSVSIPYNKAYTASLCFRDVINFRLSSWDCVISDEDGNNKTVTVYNVYRSNNDGSIKITIGIDEDDELWSTKESISGVIRCSCEFYDIFDDGNSVEININETDNTVVFNGRLIPSLPYGLTCTIVLLLKKTDKQTRFAVLEDGSLYTSAAKISGGSLQIGNTEDNGDYAEISEDGVLSARGVKISGQINASSGNIADLKIVDRGLASYDTDGNKLYSLNELGLNLYKSDAQVNVGDLTLCYDAQEKQTTITTSGHLAIRGANETQLEFMKSTSGVHRSSGITLHYQAKKFYKDSISADVWISAPSSQPLYPVTIYVEWQNSYETYGGIIPLTIRSNMSESDKINFEITNSRYSRRVRFRVDNGAWTEYVADDDMDTNVYSFDNFSSFDQASSLDNLYVTGNLVPSNNTYNLGGAQDDQFWNNIYCNTSAIDLSDRNKKNSIQRLSDAHTQIFDSLQPVSYKFNQNTSNRTHIGLIAQDVKEAVENAGLTTKDFAAYCEWEKDDGSTGCGLRYSEFISLCIDQIQKLKKRVEELEDKINNTK